MASPVWMVPSHTSQPVKGGVGLGAVQELVQPGRVLQGEQLMLGDWEFTATPDVFVTEAGVGDELTLWPALL